MERFGALTPGSFGALPVCPRSGRPDQNHPTVRLNKADKPYSA